MVTNRPLMTNRLVGLLGRFSRKERLVPVPMPIVVGAPRSGTTLLRFMLDSHPDLAIPPETGFLIVADRFTKNGDELREEFFRIVTNFPKDAPGWDDFEIPLKAFRREIKKIKPFTVADGYRAFFQLYAKRFNKPRWGDKTPTYCMHIETIGAVLPEAHFIHIIRDGRDVALSLREMWFSPGQEMEDLAAHWCKLVSAGLDHGARCRNYIRLRFEDLVRSPRETLETICRFIDLAYDDAMLNYYVRSPGRLREHKSRFRVDGSLIVTHEQRVRQQERTMQPPDSGRVFAWKRDMTAEERGRFESVAGDLLAELGYEI